MFDKVDQSALFHALESAKLHYTVTWYFIFEGAEASAALLNENQRMIKKKKMGWKRRREMTRGNVEVRFSRDMGQA